MGQAERWNSSSLGKGDYINIMDLSAMKPLDRIKQIMTSFEILTDISLYPEQKRITEEAIEQAYVNTALILQSPHQWARKRQHFTM